MKEMWKDALQKAIKSGDLGAVTDTLNAYPQLQKNINLQSYQDTLFYCTPLHIACTHKSGQSTEIINLFLELGADVNKKDYKDHKPIDLACRNKHVKAAKALISSGKLDKRDLYYAAICTGDLPLLKEVINYGNPNNRDKEDGVTPLQIACMNENYNIVEYFLNNGAEVHPPDLPHKIINCDNEEVENLDRPKQYTTPIHCACWTGNIAIVQLLIKHGANVAACDDKLTPLHIAITIGDTQLLKVLLEHVDERSIHVTDNEGETALQKACKRGDLTMAEMLIAKGADVNFHYRDGYQKSYSPLQIASASGNLKLLEKLLELGAKDSTNPGEDTLLHEACRSGSLRMVEFLMERGVTTRPTWKKNETLLHLAAFSGSAFLIDFLCKKDQFNINTKTEEGKTPLHIAAENNHTGAVDSLLEKGADPNITDNKKKTPLFIACEKGFDKVVKLLLDKKADANIPDGSGNAPIHLCTHQRISILKLILEYNTNINAPGVNNATALHIACKLADQEKIKYLVEKGANLDAAQLDGDTPLFFTCANKDFKTLMFLIELGANIHTANRYGKTPLMVVVSFKLIDFASFLIDQGVDVNACQQGGITGLSIACQNDHVEMIKLLIENKAEVNIADNEGKTPLYHACMRDSIKVAELLANNGANFGEVFHKPAPKSTYGAKTKKDVKSTQAGKLASKIIKARKNGATEPKSPGFLSSLLKK